MTVNRTTLLDLPLPVTGTESGTWGDTTNNGLTQYLDIAIAGTLVLSTDADVTLTSTEGDSSATNIGATTAQYAILRWTATGSTTRNITALAQSKTYVVINATGGTQSIVLRGAGPTTGVTIISGEKAHCVWNGSDFVKVSSSAAAGGSNTQVQYNSSGVLAGSSNLTFDGTSLTLGGNPTLSAGTANGVLYLNGSKVATSGSALTFDGTTATTPRLALGGTTLPAAGTATLFSRSSDNNTYLQTGSGNSFVVLDGSQNTMFQASPTLLGFNINNSEQMRLTSTGLGIGTSSPGARIDARISTSSTTAVTDVAYFYASSTGTATSSFGARLSLYTENANGNEYPASIAAVNDAGGSGLTNLAFYTYNGSLTERMRLDSSGNLGIGTSSPWSQLTVGSGGTANPASTVTFHNTTANEYRLKLTSATYNTNGAWLGLGFGYSDNYLKAAIIAECKDANARTNLHFCLDANSNSANAELADSKMVLTYDGNLGLGVTPSAWGGSFKAFQIASGGTSLWSDGTVAFYNRNTYYNGTNRIYTVNGYAQEYAQLNDGSHAWKVAASGTAGNAITFTQAMTLDASGNLVVGNTSANGRIEGVSTSSTYSLVANNSASSADQNFLQFRASSTIIGDINRPNTTNDIEINAGYGALTFGTGTAGTATERARITSGGDLLVGTTTQAASSAGRIVSAEASGGGIQIAHNNSGGGALYVALGGGGVATYTYTGAVGSESYTERARITSGGDLLVGASTSDLAARIMCIGSNGFAVQYGGSTGTNLQIVPGAANGTVDLKFDARSGAYPAATFWTGGSERARITSGGDLLVGKTSYGGTATGIDLGNNGFVASYSSATTSSSNSFAMYSNGASAYRFYVDWAGTVFATSTTISAISDIRFKENIQDLDVGLSAIMALKPRKFDWKAGKGKDIKGDRGFIAQEIERVFPDLIDEWKDPAPEGEEPYKSVRQDLIPVLVKAIQEQQALIESLTSRVAQLEGTQP